MNPLATTLICMLAVPLAGMLPTQASAAPRDIQLPTETAKLRPSALPGFELATQKCAVCHSADYIAYQPPQMNQSQWTAEVAKMQGTYGAQINPTDIKLIGIYLAATYGDASTVAATDLALKNAAAESPKTTGINAQALLNKNACLGCHAVSQKIVGPAYRDVAAKYNADPQAIAKIAASIRQGGAGRWGAVPMPAFASLSEPELKALAVYVLAQ